MLVRLSEQDIDDIFTLPNTCNKASWGWKRCKEAGSSDFLATPILRVGNASQGADLFLAETHLFSRMMTCMARESQVHDALTGIVASKTPSSVDCPVVDGTSEYEVSKPLLDENKECCQEVAFCCAAFRCIASKNPDR